MDDESVVGSAGAGRNSTGSRTHSRASAGSRGAGRRTPRQAARQGAGGDDEDDYVDDNDHENDWGDDAFSDTEAEAGLIPFDDLNLAPDADRPEIIQFQTDEFSLSAYLRFLERRRAGVDVRQALEVKPAAPSRRLNRQRPLLLHYIVP